MTKKSITLSTQEELKIFMSPQRQKLLRQMGIEGKSMTPKAIADMLGVSPSSAQFHIKKLEKLGLVELDHTEIINGITAKYYQLTDVNVNIGMLSEDELSKERYVIMQNLLKNSLEGFIRLHEMGLSEESLSENGDFVDGIVHLSKSDAQELLELIRNFILTHQKRGNDTEPWQYSLLLFNTGIAK